MLEKYKVNFECTVREAIEKLDTTNGKVVFITDKNDFLEGIFTQGDMRKYILKNGDLSQSIKIAMNPNPITFSTRAMARKAKTEKSMAVYPVVSSTGQLVDALFEREGDEEVISSALKNVPLVIMAGGKGTRLYPYTKILPKALIPIGDYTISERIIHQFLKYGCSKVFFCLNHKANMLKAYFNDLEKDYQVEYVVEKEFLGTGGGLSLLKGKISDTFILSNCDVLINDDLECIYRTHKMEKNKITFVCAMKNITIPYGVVQTNEEGKISSINEKPEISFLTNTGVYVIEPEVLDEIEDGKFMHLPDIAKRYMQSGEKIGVFPIAEQAWMDMGQFDEMEHMMRKYDV